MSYNIEIDSFDTQTINGLDNAVVRVKYTLTVQNFEGVDISRQYTCILLNTHSETGADITSEIDVSAFTAFESLTKEQVKQWIIEKEDTLEDLVRGLSQTMTQSPQENLTEVPW